MRNNHSPALAGGERAIQQEVNGKTERSRVAGNAAGRHLFWALALTNLLALLFLVSRIACRGEVRAAQGFGLAEPVTIAITTCGE